MMSNIFNNCGAQNGLAASRDSVKPEKQVWIYLPIIELLALDEP